MDCLVIGCGLCGMVVARTLAESGKKVTIIDKRNHIGGNIYDYKDNNNILVQKYGPHCFFTNKLEIKEYIERFVDIEDCFVECNTLINGEYIPMPFNFKSIDKIYSNKKANKLKEVLKQYFGNREIVSVTDLLNSTDKFIREYGTFMYENEYKLYTAKQWGRTIDEIEPSIFKRVPVYLSYRKEYQNHKYQFLPKKGFSFLAQRLLEHKNIKVILSKNALDSLVLDSNVNKIFWNEKELNIPVVYTGAIDELFGYLYGILPYRSLEFVWKTLNMESYQETAIVAYPQEDKITRVTEYTKLPIQKINNNKTVISIEIPFEYNIKSPVGNQPYYPVLTEKSKTLYNKYLSLTSKYKNLYIGGRLADFKYYNMDDVILRAWNLSDNVKHYFEK